MSEIKTETDELLLLAETLGDVKARTEKMEQEFSAQAKPMEAAAAALGAALAGIKSLQFHILDNNLGALSARVEEQRKVIDEQVSAIALELKKADEANATKTGETAVALRAEIGELTDKLASLSTQFGQQLERVELEAKREVEKFASVPGPKGEPGAAINPTGSYDAAKAYKRLDLVSYLGGSYLSNEDGNDEKPGPKSKKWTQMAQRGGPGGGSGDITGLTGTLLPSQIASGTAAFAVGDILYANTTGTLTKLAAGTSGKLLSTQGAGAAPIWVAATGGAGDVNGPASATDNAIVRFDGTGGKTVQNSGVTIDDSGNLTVSGGVYTGTTTETRIESSATTGRIRISGGTQDNGAGVILGGSTNAGIPNTGILAMAGATVASWSSTAFTVAGTVIHTQSATPASASAAGTTGTIAWDASYIYICTATNTWKRVAIATW